MLQRVMASLSWHQATHCGAPSVGGTSIGTSGEKLAVLLVSSHKAGCNWSNIPTTCANLSPPLHPLIEGQLFLQRNRHDVFVSLSRDKSS